MGLNAQIAGAFALDGRVAVVTGAGSGLGRECARILAGAGAAVVLGDVDAAGLEESAGIVRGEGGTAAIQPTDVSDPAQVEALARAGAAQTGTLDIWVNCAGITLWKPVTEATPDEAARVVAINQMGTYWGCAAAGRIMQAQGRGAIVNISSTAGDSPVPSLSVYGMTKAAVNQLTKVCAAEFGAAGVRVNAVIPGWIDTPINASQYHDASGSADPAMRENVLAAMRALSPLGMTGVPADIALAVLYLASDASRFVTGHLLRVSGGVSM